MFKSYTKSKFLAFFALIALFSAVTFAGECAASGSGVSAADYSKASNWIYRQDGIIHKADMFYVYPTVTVKGEYAPVEDAVHRAAAQKIFARHGAQFFDCANVYAPYYRQASMEAQAQAARGSMTRLVEYYKTTPGWKDIQAALDYYFKNCNSGRPVIFAGHSQGSGMIKVIFEEYMKKHPEYLSRVVAAYALGFSFTPEWLEANPHLTSAGIHFAEGETDTGAIISWNTEGPGAKRNVMLEADSYVINPLNWKTDDTYAEASLNLGGMAAKKTNPGVYSVVEGVCDAQINTARHSLIVSEKYTVDSEYAIEYTQGFGDKSLHAFFDGDLFYKNIGVNAAKRIDEFCRRNNSQK